MSGDAPITFGQRVKRHRREAGLSQERLAELAGIGLRTLSDIENGTTTYPHEETAERLLDALPLEPDEHATLLALLRASPRRGAVHYAPRPQRSSDAHYPLSVAPELPLPLTAVVGREREIDALTRLLRQARDGAATRLLTITGPGGVGKTRLALEVASRLRDAFLDGVLLVELAALDDPSIVVPTIARKLGLRESSRQSLLDTLRLHLCAKDLLLVLDNFEQVAPAAPRVAELLSACPSIIALVTSRAVLRVRGEQVLELELLELPETVSHADVEAIGRCAAVGLFVQRVRAVVPGFTLDATSAPSVAALCLRLDGLPLAIELAAPWVKVMPPGALLARLAHAEETARSTANPALELLADGALDLPERQRTLRGTMAWSYNLLSAREQGLFRRLSVFVDGCTLDAAAAVCADPRPPEGIGVHGDSDVARDMGMPEGLDVSTPVAQAELLADVAALAGQSLLRLETTDDAATARVGMLRTLREYGLECLAASGERDAVRKAHALYYLAQAEQAATQLTGPHQEVWLERLSDEEGNHRAALIWAAESNELEIGLRLAAALSRFWYLNGPRSEGRAWLERLLQRDGRAAVDAAVQARALNGAGVLAHFQGDYARAAELHEESLRLRRRLGNKADIAGSLNNLALVARQQGHYARAAELFEQSLALRREIGDTWGIYTALGNLASVALDQGEYARAAPLYAECLALSRAQNDAWSVVNTLAALALVAHYQGDYTRMPSLAEESVALARTLGDKTSLAYALANLALARQHCDGILAAHAPDRVTLADAHALYGESLELYWSMGDKVGVAVCLDGLAEIAHALGQPERAARLMGATAALREAIGSPVRPSDQARRDAGLTAVRIELGDDAFAAAWAAGAAADLQQIVADCALGEDCGGA